MARAAPGLIKPALIGGVIFGFLGGAPLVEILNCACCILVIGAGFVAGLLYSRQCRESGVPFDPAGGAKVGFVAGLFYGFAETVTTTLSRVLFHEAATEWVIDILEEIPSIPDQVTEQMTRGWEQGFVAGTLWTLITAIAFGIIFATIGGLIAGAVFKTKPAPSVEPVG